VEKVWKALTDKDQMKQWYFDLNEFKPEVGFEFSFAGKGHKGQEYLHLCTVTQVVPEKKLSYSWKYKGYPGNSEVTFELFAEGHNTRIRLTHAGLNTFPQDNADFARGSFNHGWTELIGTYLPKFVERTS
jgi:uncharacterized protein YndB with AHSA1/START domain